MTRSRSLAIAAVSTALIATTTLPAHADSTGGAQVSHVSVSYSVGAVQYDGPGCIEIPVTLNYQKSGPADLVQAVVIVGLTYGDEPIEAPGSDYLAPEAPAVSTQTTSAAFCTPSIKSDAGPLLVKGTITGGSLDEADQTAPLSASPATVVLNPTTVSKVRLVRSGKNVQVDGVALAKTLTHGEVGTDGLLRVEAKAPKGSTWSVVGTTYVNSSGTWKTLARAPRGKSFAKGTVFRATLSGCDWCTDASASSTLR